MCPIERMPPHGCHAHRQSRGVPCELLDRMDVGVCFACGVERALSNKLTNLYMCWQALTRDCVAFSVFSIWCAMEVLAFGLATGRAAGRSRMLCINRLLAMHVPQRLMTTTGASATGASALSGLSALSASVAATSASRVGPTTAAMTTSAAGASMATAGLWAGNNTSQRG